MKKAINTLESLAKNEKYLKKDIYLWMLLDKTKNLIISAHFGEDVLCSGFPETEILFISKTRRSIRARQKLLRNRGITSYIRKICKKDIMKNCFIP